MTNFTSSVKIYDEDESIKLIHYTTEGKGYDFIRGIIFETKSDDPLKAFENFYEQPDSQSVDIVGRSFPMAPEVVASNKDEIAKIDLGSVKISESHEGTVVRAFYARDKWYFSTHRKLDMFKSKWAGPSFGQIFLDCLKNEADTNTEFISHCPDLIENQDLDTFCSYLNKNNCYVFLMSNHPQNGIVCHGDMKLFHIGTFTRASGTWMLPVQDFIGLSEPSVIEGVQDLAAYVESMDPTIYQGVLVTLSLDKQVKILNTQYDSLVKIRGNDPDIERRYLQVRKESEKVASLKEVYPEHVQLFSHLELDLHSIVRILHKLYLIRHVYNGGMFITLPKEDHIIIEKCHEWHHSDKENNKVKLMKIREVIEDTEYYYIYKILKRYRSEDSPYPALLQQS